MNKELVIVSDNLWIYTFCKNIKEADNKLLEAKETLKKDISLYSNYTLLYPDNSEYWQNRLDEAKNKTYKIMTYADYEKAEREHYINRPIKEIDEKTYNDMLNVLPPLNWVTINGVNEFCISEMYSGLYTDQYAKYHGKYYTKLVDAYDKSTWIHNFL